MASSAQDVPLDQSQNDRTRTRKSGDLLSTSQASSPSTNPPPPAGGPLVKLSVEQTLFNQRKRMRVTQLRAMFAEAYREIEEETALMRLQSARALTMQASRPSGTSTMASTTTNRHVHSQIGLPATSSPTPNNPSVGPHRTIAATSSKERGLKVSEFAKCGGGGADNNSTKTAQHCDSHDADVSQHVVLWPALTAGRAAANGSSRLRDHLPIIKPPKTSNAHHRDPVPTAVGDGETAAAAATVEATQHGPELLLKGNAAVRGDDWVVKAGDVTMEEVKIDKDTAEPSRVPRGEDSAVHAGVDDVGTGKVTAAPSVNSGDEAGAVPPTSAKKTQVVRSVVGRALTAAELLGTSHGAPLKRSRSVLKGAGKREPSFSLLARSHIVANDGAAGGAAGGEKGTKAAGDRDAFFGGDNNKKKRKPNSTSVGVPSGGASETHNVSVASRATGGTHHTAATNRGKSARNSAARSAKESGPFSGLSICAVRLGSVTTKTVATWMREVGRGGGVVTTSYSPGETTHILVDASVSWATLERHGGLAAVADRGGAAAAAGQRNVNDMATMPGQEVPVVGTGWMVECLTRSAIVDVEPYRMIRPPSLELALLIEPSPVAGIAAAPATVTIDKSMMAATTADEAVVTVGSKAARQAPEDVERSVGDLSCTNAATMPAGLQRTREDREGKREGVELEGDGEAGVAAATLDAGAVAGGIGAANPNIVTQRSKFFCQSGSSRGHRPCNDQAARSLESLAEMYAVLNGNENVWRAKGLKRAAAVMRGLGVNITRFDQLKEIKKNEPSRMRGIGNSVMVMLEEFFSGGKMGRLEGLSSVSRVRAMKELTRIWGVGPKTADELIEAGFHTVEDVRRRGRHKLNRHQLVGLDRYEDLLERMPRSEAAEIEATVAQAARKLCPGVQCQACGSYRRGKETCGDVDVLIQPPKGEEDCSVLVPLLDSLRASGFLTDDLALPKDHEPGSPQSYMGVCKLPGEGRRHRRLDVKLYPTSMFGFALLYFTGSNQFNCSMRYFAKLKGLRLSDKGLRPVNRVSGKKVHTFPSYSCPTEQDVFVSLGLEWRDPTDRSGYDVNPVEGESARYRAMGLGTVAGGYGASPTTMGKPGTRVPNEMGLPDEWGTHSEVDEEWEEWPEAALGLIGGEKGGRSFEHGVFGGAGRRGGDSSEENSPGHGDSC